jgi:hypothetical protein
MQRPRFSGWTIGPTLFKFLEGILKPGMRTIECGSGLSTWLFLNKGCVHIALEHKKEFAFNHPCVIVSELVGIPPWYRVWPKDGPYDVVLVDGPNVEASSRLGVIKCLDFWVGDNTAIILDDTERSDEAVLAGLLQRFLKRHKRIDLFPQHKLDRQKLATVFLPADQANGLQVPTQ